MIYHTITYYDIIQKAKARLRPLFQEPPPSSGRQPPLSFLVLLVFLLLCYITLYYIDVNMDIDDGKLRHLR